MKKALIAFLCGMFLTSIAGILGFPYAGISVFIGVIAFFVSKPKGTYTNSGFDLGTVRNDLQKKGIWVWIALPLILDAISLLIANAVLPAFIEHVIMRTSPILSFDKIPLLILQLIILAVGEEIAWRAFFQKQLSNYMPLIPAIAISSIAFSLGHFSSGSPLIIVYDLLWIAANSCVYGYIFHKTNNAWVSTISHLLANSFSIIGILLFI